MLSTTTTKQLKLLFLGTGESGKLTLSRQFLQYLSLQNAPFANYSHDEEFSNYFCHSRLKMYVDGVKNSCLQSIYTFVKYVRKQEASAPWLHSKETIGALNAFEELNQIQIRVNTKMDTSYASHLKHLLSVPQFVDYLYNEEKFAKVLSQEECSCYCENIRYWLENFERISATKYFPTEEDVYHMRIKTTGVLETKMKIADELNTTKLKVGDEKYEFNITVVGSQRNERKKWSYAMREVSAIIYVVSLGEWNQLLYEDGTTNRLDESLLVFKDVVNSFSLENVPVFVYVNKSDVFQDKLRLSSESIQHLNNANHTVHKLFTTPSQFFTFAEHAKHQHQMTLPLLPPTNFCSKILHNADHSMHFKPLEASTMVTKPFANASLLPDDIMGYIASFLDVPTLHNLSLVSKDFHRIINQEFIWKDLCFNFLKQKGLTAQNLEQVHELMHCLEAQMRLEESTCSSVWKYFVKICMEHSLLMKKSLINMYSSEVSSNRSAPIKWYQTCAFDANGPENLHNIFRETIQEIIAFEESKSDRSPRSKRLYLQKVSEDFCQTNSTRRRRGNFIQKLFGKLFGSASE